MLGFARKLLYRAASAIERHGDRNYYFLGFENKIDHIHAFNLLLKLFERKSAGVERKFWRLVDIAAKMDEPDLASFKFKTAISGTSFFEGISVEGSEYLLEKAYRRGISLRQIRTYKSMLNEHLRIMCNSIYGILPNLPLINTRKAFHTEICLLSKMEKLRYNFKVDNYLSKRG